MKISQALVIVIPIGPNCQYDFICDTLESIRFYVHDDYRVVLADDSHAGMGRNLQGLYPDLDVIEMKRSMGKLGGLYLTLSEAFVYVLEKYHFTALLRMDTDALITGHDPGREAMKLFTEDPSVGIAGQYPLDYNGDPWDISWPAGQLYKITSTHKLLFHPLRNLALLKLYRQATRNGYRRGESVFGGACFYSEALLRTFYEKGMLPKHILAEINLEEDHLFSLLAMAAGFKLGSLSGPGMPMGCAWKGLPDSPQRLLDAGRKIVHSTRFWKELDESAIRRQFRAARTG